MSPFAPPERAAVANNPPGVSLFTGCRSNPRYTLVYRIVQPWEAVMAGVVGSVLVVGTVAIAFSGLISLRPSQTTIQGTHELVDKISQQAPVAPRPVVLVNTISREHCHYNTDADIRVCIDLQTRARHRDMKDANGNWSVVALE